jgi:hypothetical protein
MEWLFVLRAVMAINNYDYCYEMRIKFVEIYFGMASEGITVYVYVIIIIKNKTR